MGKEGKAHKEGAKKSRRSRELRRLYMCWNFDYQYTTGQGYFSFTRIT